MKPENMKNDSNGEAIWRRIENFESFIYFARPTDIRRNIEMAPNGIASLFQTEHNTFQL